jgi:CTP:molybdopterin cytidylyltransferase MocA
MRADAGNVGGIAGVVLAAGAGSRFGEQKLLARHRDRPLLEHVLWAVARTRLDPVIVVVGADADRLLAAVDLRGAMAVVCQRWAEGQSASLRTGLEAAGDRPAVIVLGDQPLLRPAAVDRVIAARRRGAIGVRATYGGRPGHPVLLERPLIRLARQLQGDEGARRLLRGQDVVEVACDGLGGDVDVDTPQDLEALWRVVEESAPHREEKR